MEPPVFSRKVAKEFLAQHDPELWKRCYPRVYAEPSACGKYYSAKEISTEMMATAMRADAEGFAGQSQVAEVVWASKLASLRVPTYWVGNDMAQAIQQTVPLVEFDWAATKLPFDAMAFMVPKGLITHEEPGEGEAMFVSFARLKNGDQIPALPHSGPRFFNIMENAFSCFACTTTEALMHWTYASEKGKTKINLTQLDQEVQEFAKHPHSTYSIFSSELTMLDNRFMARVSHFIFGAILLMLTRPEHVTVAKLHKRVVKAGSAPKEFWHPNVIGLDYRLKRVWQGGTHASPRYHWVRGVNKSVPYGEKRLLRKMKWIEPYQRGV